MAPGVLLLMKVLRIRLSIQDSEKPCKEADAFQLHISSWCAPGPCQTSRVEEHGQPPCDTQVKLMQHKATVNSPTAMGVPCQQSLL